MTDEYMGFNDKFEAEAGSGEFIVHPEGWEGKAVFEETERVTEGNHVKAVILHMNCDGAKISDYISLKTTEKYTSDIIKWKVSLPLVASGLRKHGARVSPADLIKLKGKTAMVRLAIDEFVSKKGNSAGKTLHCNRVDRYLDADSVKSTTTPKAAPATEEEDNDYDF